MTKEEISKKLSDAIPKTKPFLRGQGKVCYLLVDLCKTANLDYGEAHAIVEEPLDYLSPDDQPGFWFEDQPTT